MTDQPLICPACNSSWDVPIEPDDPCPHCGEIYLCAEDDYESAIGAASRRALGGDNIVREQDLDLFTAARFESLSEAQVARSALDAAGIPSIIVAERAVDAHGMVSNRPSGVTLLQVQFLDCERASQVLEDARAAAATADEASDTESRDDDDVPAE